MVWQQTLPHHCTGWPTISLSLRVLCLLPAALLYSFSLFDVAARHGVVISCTCVPSTQPTPVLHQTELVFAADSWTLPGCSTRTTSTASKVSMTKEGSNRDRYVQKSLDSSERNNHLENSTTYQQRSKGKSGNFRLFCFS